ncbi:MAG: tRNA 2-selenouridine(34) synthase MnmH [Bacteroides sp.]|jgi:tRNA 2-selenouridine synthase|nr:tRNA 2-selenouridine(34) synthase MnmH [Bacteroides sp.]
MIKTIDISEFLSLKADVPVLDVRSPSEFSQGHIPGANNLPLFDDEERKVVGTLYKKSGREAAILEGLDFAGRKLRNFVKQAKKAAPGKKLLMHCWRGGMRSESMAWLLNLAGFDVYLLKGGYKAYRRHVLSLWEKPARIMILSGKTGTGKTEILKHMQELGQQVIDLEGIAHHKGSAFGAIGESPQPSSEQFENELADQWTKIDHSLPVWLEDESHTIGRVFIPHKLYQQMHQAQVIRLEMPKNLRVKRLIEDYAGFEKVLLVQSIEKIQRKLGGQNARTAIEALHQDDFETAIAIVLDYYDKAYTFDLGKRKPEQFQHFETHTEQAQENARLVLEQINQLTHEQG